MNSVARVQSDNAKTVPQRTVLRCAIASAISLAVVIYLLAAVLGMIPEQRKLGAADLGIIVLGVLGVGVLLKPEVLEKISHLKVGGVELDLLQKLQDGQRVQQRDLDNLRFVLTLLLQDSECEHLRKLEKGETQGYIGRHELRTELRKLRGLGLIRTRRPITEMIDKAKFDLKDFVELTERGRYYLERLRDGKEPDD